jgi:DNA-directed RNA polymerase specialized sigma24 family protein
MTAAFRMLPVVEPERPRVRSECGTIRPCPHYRCVHHALIERPLRGEERRRNSVPWLPGARLHPAARDAKSLSDALSKLPSSCVLDAVDAAPDGLTLPEVGAVLGISGEAVRLIERRALHKMRDVAKGRFERG